MKHFLLIYTLAPDYLERRAALRKEHLDLTREAADKGELLLGGALNPPDEALLLFAGQGPEAAEAFARADPYVTQGLVTEWRVREWVTVAGKGAASEP
ncbi:YciI-like protein [Altericroceibacterium xinjiangense]|uniref:YciI-like protein n=1 Tax=Altericroceibacterium xinjiangense TaxID=762261 RepID=UPI000F7FAB16|nr:YciI-like protein [Altericroceibacterium xinjiangense]